MEASNLLRSGSFHTRSGSFQFRRSTSVGKLVSSRPTMVHMTAKEARELRRVRSETDLIGSGPALAPSLPLPLNEDDKDAMTGLKSRALTVQGIISKEDPMEEINEERDSFGGGMGKGGNISRGGKGGHGGSDQSENRGIHDRYKELLRSDPGNPLLLRNYGKFLQEVEGDVKAAEECYGRAILASPGDGEVLMLYGMLVWEHYREKERAGAYLQRAVEVSPDDCMVLAARARFLWEVEEDEDEDEDEDERTDSMATSSQPLVVAF